MSRIGKLPIDVPAGVTVTVGDVVTIKGPKGQLEQSIVDGITVAVDDGVIVVSRNSDSKPVVQSTG